APMLLKHEISMMAPRIVVCGSRWVMGTVPCAPSVTDIGPESCGALPLAGGVPCAVNLNASSTTPAPAAATVILDMARTPCVFPACARALNGNYTADFMEDQSFQRRQRPGQPVAATRGESIVAAERRPSVRVQFLPGGHHRLVIVFREVTPGDP